MGEEWDFIEFTDGRDADSLGNTISRNGKLQEIRAFPGLGEYEQHQEPVKLVTGGVNGSVLPSPTIAPFPGRRPFEFPPGSRETFEHSDHSGSPEPHIHDASPAELSEMIVMHQPPNPDDRDNSLVTFDETPMKPKVPLTILSNTQAYGRHGDDADDIVPGNKIGDAARVAEKVESLMINTDRQHIKGFQMLRDKRMAVLGLRALVRERRTNLRYHRERLLDQDGTFLQELRKAGVSDPVHEKATLLEFCRKMQTDRESLLELENGYNTLERQLDREEWDLKDLEARVYESFIAAEDPLFSAATLSASLPVGPHSDYGDSQCSVAGVLDYYTILRNRYLSRKGDADILEEQLQVLRGSRAHFVEEEKARQQMNLELNEEGRDFLQTFDERHNDLQVDLRQVREDLFDLRTAMLGQDDNLFKETLFSDTPWESYCSMPQDELLNDFPVENLHPLLDRGMLQAQLLEDTTIETLPQILDYEAQETKFSQVGLSISEVVVHIPSFFNEWSLRIMRQSFMEVHRFLNILKPILRKSKLFLPSWQITDLALGNWADDTTTSGSKHAWEKESEGQSIVSQVNPWQYTNRSVRSDSLLNRRDRLRLRFSGVGNALQNASKSAMLRKVTRFWKPVSNDSVRSA